MCIDITEMPLFISSKTVLPVSTVFSGSNITGWWVIINSQLFFIAVFIADAVQSSATTAPLTSADGSPTNMPALSKSQAVFTGAIPFRNSKISFTVIAYAFLANESLSATVRLNTSRSDVESVSVQK